MQFPAWCIFWWRKQLVKDELAQFIAHCLNRNLFLGRGFFTKREQACKSTAKVCTRHGKSFLNAMERVCQRHVKVSDSNGKRVQLPRQKFLNSRVSFRGLNQVWGQNSLLLVRVFFCVFMDWNLILFWLKWSRGIDSQDLVNLALSRNKPYEVNSR